MKRHALIHTLGCRLNTADSALLSARLEAAGYLLVNDTAPQIELIVVNSCTVTAEAGRKSRQAVRKFRQQYPQSLIVVTGCSAELERSHYLEDGAADVVLTNPEKRSLAELVGEYLAGRRDLGGAALSMDEHNLVFSEKIGSIFPFRSRAFLKIQEGCNNFCSYCIVPYVRGRERSRSFDECLSDCRKAVADGFAEIVLTGVNTCAYLDQERDLAALVREICQIDGDFRIRLSSTEPHLNNMNLLDVMAGNDRVCRFLHLSLQHGDDQILTAMNRKYTTRDYAQFVAEARRRIPGIHIGSDLIVGYPGETGEAFDRSLEFVKQMEFANLHIFSFSPRPGTPAAKLKNQLPSAVVKERYGRLKQVAEASAAAFLARNHNCVLPVIFEEETADGQIKGWSDNYIEIKAKAGEYPLNKIVGVLYQ